jgi:hypothetical protein
MDFVRAYGRDMRTVLAVVRTLVQCGECSQRATEKHTWGYDGVRG